MFDKIKTFLTEESIVHKFGRDGEIVYGRIPTWLDKAEGVLAYGVCGAIAYKAGRVLWDDAAVATAKIFTKLKE